LGKGPWKRRATLSPAETGSRSTRAIHLSLDLDAVDGTAINDLLGFVKVVDARPHQPAALSDGRPSTGGCHLQPPATRSDWSARFLVRFPCDEPNKSRPFAELSLCSRVAAQGLFGLNTLVVEGDEGLRRAIKFWFFSCKRHYLLCGSRIKIVVWGAAMESCLGVVRCQI
ncbi:hypothetical protein PspLS_01921, partial [Pyricularia sp. CBS 133598]